MTAVLIYWWRDLAVGLSSAALASLVGIPLGVWRRDPPVRRKISQ